jgi:hypothetical protein
MKDPSSAYTNVARNITIGSWWLLLLATTGVPYAALAFLPPSSFYGKSPQSSLLTSLQEDATILSRQEETNRYTEVQSMTMMQLKTELFDVLATMKGKSHEFRRVEELINTLEDRYVPAQTLEFWNLIHSGTWQLLFSTNLVGTPNPQLFRLRSLTQTVQSQKFQGNVTNDAVWDLSQHSPQDVEKRNSGAVFDCTGQFRVQVSYEIPSQNNGGGSSARPTLQLQNHVLLPARGSPIPQNIPALVGLLHRSIPPQLFDPSQLIMDTTYVDEDLRIVRYAGYTVNRQNLEGVRDVFRRIGNLVVE